VRNVGLLIYTAASRLSAAQTPDPEPGFLCAVAPGSGRPVLTVERRPSLLHRVLPNRTPLWQRRSQIVPLAELLSELIGKVSPFLGIANATSCRRDRQRRPPMRPTVNRHSKSGLKENQDDVLGRVRSFRQAPAPS
jgi:hypothetical protein